MYFDKRGFQQRRLESNFWIEASIYVSAILSFSYWEIFFIVHDIRSIFSCVSSCTILLTSITRLLESCWDV